MKYRIIGDIHGRDNWQKLIEKDDANMTHIFLGDFTDPYYGYENNLSYEKMIEQINIVLEYKRILGDRVVILAANHDNQYWLMHGDTNRYDVMNAYEIHSLFIKNKDLFYGASFNIGNKYVISHAGITLDWYERTFNSYETNLDTITESINHIYNSGNNGKKMFTFEHCSSTASDYYGTSSGHSPIWVRPYTLWKNNLFGFGSGVIQVIGHTPFQSNVSESNGKIATLGTKKIPMTDKEFEDYSIIKDCTNKCVLVENDYEHVDIILCDCLSTETACVEINGDNLSWKKVCK